MADNLARRRLGLAAPALIVVLALALGLGIVAGPLPAPAADDEAGEDHRRGWVGLVIRNLSNKEQETYGSEAVYVVQIQPGTPAERAGFRPKDVIVEIDRRRPIEGAKGAVEDFRSWKPGRRVRFRVVREDGVTTELAVDVDAYDPSKAARAATKRAVVFLLEEAAKGDPGTPGAAAKRALALYAISRAPEVARLRREEQIAALVAQVRTEVTARCDPAQAGVAGGARGEFRNYAAPLAAAALHRLDPEGSAEAVASLRSYLQKRQLGVAGGAAGDFGEHRGAWNYLDIDQPGGQRGDLSVTSIAIEGLALSGDDLSLADASVEAVRTYLEARQNYGLIADGARPDGASPAHDGGFHFAPGEGKAGQLPVSGTDQWIVASYGSATADGLRTLLRLGADRRSPRVQAALGWLLDNFTARRNPGFGDAGGVGFDMGLQFYWLRAVTDALSEYDEHPIETADGRRFAWAQVIIDWLSARQHMDGRWVSRHRVMGEDDPVVSTAFSLLAVADCVRFKDRFVAETKKGGVKR